MSVQEKAVFWLRGYSVLGCISLLGNEGLRVGPGCRGEVAGVYLHYYDFFAPEFAH